MLARTAADNNAFTWLNIKTYAVCCRLIPKIQAITPNKGPRWAEAGGKSLDSLEEVDFINPANDFNIWTSAPETPTGSAELNDRSHIDSRALP